ncbi:hypothetical protein [Chryseobacterium sp. JK1]|uniref:hypothetical protein n=1 Tax=Chryseobacterium sp. JK1 TaxID=874294 RepID=UPI003D69B988
MPAKYLTLLLTCFYLSVFGQLRLEFQVNGSVAKVTISNNSKDSYAIPLETEHFRPYEPLCDNYQEYEDSFPGLGLMLMIEKQSTNELLTYYVQDYVDPDKFDSIAKEYQKQKIANDHLIEEWKRIHKIAKVKDAKINYDIMNNLLFLKPYESISYKVNINLNNITNQKFKFYSYSYDSHQSYRYYLEYCSPAKAYGYLTKQQKNTIKEKGYKLFYEKLRSNVIMVK